jgi:hypothetical protein
MCHDEAALTATISTSAFWFFNITWTAVATMNPEKFNIRVGNYWRLGLA